jgi:CarD family transcriptional regulator, regulator of rRNA transcription
MFSAGDTIVYPHHGAGRVLEIVEQEFQGRPRPYYSILILHNDLTVLVPVDLSDKAGIRPVISALMVEQVLGVLRNDPTGMPVNWSHRVKHNQEKIKTGDVLELADVVRNLALRDREKGLSTGEKQMLHKARRILASEIMCAKDVDEEAAQRMLDTVLGEACAAGRFSEN